MPSADTAPTPGPRPGPGLPPELRGRFVVRRDGRRSALVRADFVRAFDAAGLLEAASLEPAELVARLAGRGADASPYGGAADGSDNGSGAVGRGARLLPIASGRGAVAVVPAGSLGEAVVRPYRRGGLASRFSRRLYLAGRRGRRELIVSERLRRRGVPVVEPLACVREALGPGYRAALVTRFVQGARPAGEVLAGPGAAVLMRALGRTAARLHAAGGWHADLHADNFLVRPPEGGPRPSTGDRGPRPSTGDRGPRPSTGDRGPRPSTGERGAGPSWDPVPLLVDLDRGRLFPFPVPVAVGRWSLRRLGRHLRKRGLAGALAAMGALEEAYLEARGREARARDERSGEPPSGGAAGAGGGSPDLP